MKRILSLALWIGFLAGPAAAQNADAGKQVFRSCAGCHQVGPSAKNRAGPVLNDIVGRTAGSFAGFRYSSSMKAAGAAGLVWSEDNLFAYIADPSGFLKTFLNDPKARAKMSFRLKSESKRRDVAAYLATITTAAADVPETGFCIVNASQGEYLFATETREGVRQVSSLAPGGRLCAEQTGATDGIVTVYDGTRDYEGCSRIIPVGVSEDMLEYAEAGRCGWGSHKS